MARYYGTIGFVLDHVKTAPGVWNEVVVKRNYYGDVMKRRVSWEKGESINDDVKINNQISILADEFAERNAYAMKWIEWKGVRWKVTSIEFERPRMILTIGDVYKDITEENDD